jgi:hypothetical protein
MSDDLLDQLADYGRFHRLHQTSVSVADVAERGSRPSLAEPPPPRAPRPRLILVAAGAGAAALLVAATVLVSRADDEDVRVRTPGDTIVSTTTVPPSRVAEAPLPPEGAPPSTPATGEVIAAIDFFAGESIDVYADGRVLRYQRGFGPGFSGSARVPGGVAEQRLTRDGVERVRSEFLATGLFDAGPPPDDAQVESACSCTLRVRVGGDLLSTGDLPPEPLGAGDGEVGRKVDRLVELVTALDSVLPPSAWADRTVGAYVPSRYRVCVVTGEHAPQVLPDASAVIAQALPGRVAEILAGITTCIDLTPRDARALAKGLADADIRYLAGSGFSYGVPASGPGQSLFDIAVQPLLPDGAPPSVIFG